MDRSGFAWPWPIRAGFEALIEEIDIGGPSMVRAAAKNFRDVLVVVDPSDYPRVLEDLSAPGGSTAKMRMLELEGVQLAPERAPQGAFEF